MSIGQSIRILLADGTVTGIRHAEVVNWTIQAVACPRSRIAELTGWDEAARPGVYCLFGQSEDGSGGAVYIGEAENVRDRLHDHVASKEFWNEVILFTSKDQNLTKAHVKYLESRIWTLSRDTKRYTVTNGNEPQKPLLPRGDRDSMEAFLGQVRVLLGVLGHKLLEPLAFSPAVAAPKQSVTPTVQASGLSGTELTLQTRVLKAAAVVTDEGIVVRAGSTASMTEADSIGGTYKRLRQELQASGSLAVQGDKLIFTRDHLFSSPTAAAATVLGYAVNGRDQWKTASGLTFNELESGSPSA